MNYEILENYMPDKKCNCCGESGNCKCTCNCATSDKSCCSVSSSFCGRMYKKFLLKAGFKFHVMQIWLATLLIGFVLVSVDIIDENLGYLLHLLLISILLSILSISLNLCCVHCYYKNSKSCPFFSHVARVLAVIGTTLFTVVFVVIFSMLICSSTQSSGCSVSPRSEQVVVEVEETSSN